MNELYIAPATKLTSIANISGWWLCDRGEGRWRGLQEDTKCHGHSPLQPWGPEQCVQSAFIHPSPGQCLLPQAWGTTHVHIVFQHHKSSSVFQSAAFSSDSDWRARNGRRRKCSGDPRGGRTASDFSRRTAESHHLQNDGKIIYIYTSMLVAIFYLYFFAWTYTWIIIRSPLINAENERIWLRVSEREAGRCKVL